MFRILILKEEEEEEMFKNVAGVFEFFFWGNANQVT